MLIPRGGAEWEDTRLFSSFSAVEQAMKKGHYDWCFAIAFDGIDELLPVYLYHFKNGAIVREPIPSP
jgi:hypothetical protein